MWLEQRTLDGQKFLIYCFLKIRFLLKWMEYDRFTIWRNYGKFILSCSERKLKTIPNRYRFTCACLTKEIAKRKGEVTIDEIWEFEGKERS